MAGAFQSPFAGSEVWIWKNSYLSTLSTLWIWSFLVSRVCFLVNWFVNWVVITSQTNPRIFGSGRYVTAVKHPVIFVLDDVSREVLVPLLCTIDAALRTQESPFFMFIIATRITAVDDEAGKSLSASFDWILLDPLTIDELRMIITKLLLVSRNLNHYHHCPRLFSQTK